MTITELARRIARWRALEYAAARTLGEWIPVVDPPGLRPVLAGWSEHFAWHVSLWDDRAPAVIGVDLLGDLPAGGSTTVVDVDIAAGVDGLISVLMAEVWQPLIDELSGLAAVTDPRLDGPTVRVVDLVLADLRRDLDAARSVASAR